MNHEFLKMLCEQTPEEEIEWALWIISGPLSLMFALLSTWGNLLSLRILRKLSIRRSIRFYLSVLAISNASISLCTLWYYALGETLRPFFGSIDFFNLLTVFLHPVSSFSLTMSVWMMLTVTVDRFFALSRPLHHRATESYIRARTVAFTLVAAAAIFSIPTAFELRLTYDCDVFYNHSSLKVLPTELRVNETYLLVYQLLLTSVFIHVGPLLLITFFTLRMIYIVYSAKALRYGMDARGGQSKSSGSENTTRMLLTVVVKFLICNSPSMMLNLWEKFAGSTTVGSLAAFRFCVEWSNLLVVINSASDSIVYLRWKRQQTSSVTYTPVRRTLFNADEAEYIHQRARKIDFEQLSQNLSTSIVVPNPSQGCFVEKEKIKDLLRKLFKSVGDVSSEHTLICCLHEIGLQHKDVPITVQQWKLFKATFIKETSEGADTAIWSKLVCFVIKEFRNGQNCAPRKPSERSCGTPKTSIQLTSAKSELLLA